MPYPCSNSSRKCLTAEVTQATAPSASAQNERPPMLVQTLKNFEAGKAEPGDIEKLLDVSEDIGGRSFCALADGAVACLTSAIKHFRDEFEQGMHTPAWELFPYERSTLFSTADVGAAAEGARA